MREKTKNINKWTKLFIEQMFSYHKMDREIVKKEKDIRKLVKNH